MDMKCGQLNLKILEITMINVKLPKENFIHNKRIFDADKKVLIGFYVGIGVIPSIKLEEVIRIELYSGKREYSKQIFSRVWINNGIIDYFAEGKSNNGCRFESILDAIDKIGIELNAESWRTSNEFRLEELLIAIANTLQVQSIHISRR